MKFIATHMKTINIVLGFILLATVIILGSNLLCIFHAFRIATTLYPKCSDARIDWAYDLYQNEHYHEAIQQLNKANQIDPNDQITHQYLGNCWFQLWQYQKATDEFAKAVRLAPNNSFSRVGLGSSLYKEGRYDDAITNLTAAMRLKPDDSVAKDWLMKARRKKQEMART